MSYYYTAAALPTIRLGERAPISEARFFQLVEDTLSAEEYRIICKSRWGSVEPTGSLFADRILSWEKELRLELAKARLAALQFSSPQALPESDGRDVLLEKARHAMSLESPLAAETYLNKLRWSFVEEVSATHFFDLEALIAYFLKLQIALRQEKYQKDAGQKAFDQIFEKVGAHLSHPYRIEKD